MPPLSSLLLLLPLSSVVSSTVVFIYLLFPTSKAFFPNTYIHKKWRQSCGLQGLLHISGSQHFPELLPLVIFFHGALPLLFPCPLMFKCLYFYLFWVLWILFMILFFFVWSGNFLIKDPIFGSGVVDFVWFLRSAEGLLGSWKICISFLWFCILVTFYYYGVYPGFLQGVSFVSGCWLGTVAVGCFVHCFFSFLSFI